MNKIVINTSPGVCLVSKTEPRILSYWNFMQIEIIVLTSKNTIFNWNSFANSEIAIEFVMSKQVQIWIWILILSPSLPCTHNKATLIDIFHSLSWKKYLFANYFKHTRIIYRSKAFSSNMNSRLLPQNKALFGSN